MIYLLWATIRPDMMRETYKIWMDKATNKENIKVKLAVNTEEEKLELSEFEDITVTNQKHTGTVYPIYCLTSKLEINDDDLIIITSDDFYPPENWDEFLLGKLKGKTACYFVNDGYQIPDNSSGLNKSITMPVMTGSCLKKLNNLLYSLDYVHYYSDTELYNNLTELDLLIDERHIDATTFTHKNWAVHGGRKADEHDSAYNIHMYQDRHTYIRREQIPVAERIKKTEGVW